MTRFFRLLVWVLAAAAGTLAASEASFACSKTLVFGTTDYPPYVIWQKDGRVSGLDADLLAGVMKRAGCAYRFKWVPFKRALRDVAFGALDGMPVVSQNPERAKTGYFTLTMRHEFIAAFVRADDSRALAMTSLDGLIASNLKVSYVLGGWHGKAFMDAVEHNANFKRRVRTVTDFETLFKALHAGLTDIAVVDILIGRQILKDHPTLGPILALPFPVNTDNLSMMLSKKTVTEADVAKINAALKAFRASPDYMNTIRAYASPDMADYIAGKAGQEAD
ncbi:substrate-binding periplasmic protein [Kordiimonas marina]|uniref:substrate-binding periplasmic protein n=1 Tax=Kordiimonas marina TaxID=2872312 RepID=UPI001FF1B4AA|nr:transporter substrate-binding domain-containing protein [Kordiimonas marina]MCJ9429886.1 transporter substrate-binding domain-containing protein [Kordiimonas marina]